MIFVVNDTTLHCSAMVFGVQTRQSAKTLRQELKEWNNMFKSNEFAKSDLADFLGSFYGHSQFCYGYGRISEKQLCFMW